MDRRDLENIVDERLSNSLQQHRTGMLQDMERIVSKISEASTSNQLTKFTSILQTGAPTFKRKSNEEQFKYNSKVSVALQEAGDLLSSDKVAESRQKIAEAQNLVAHRQKLIRLADSSDMGWRLVQEYETNQLASDSDDEKRMYKAEARASKKLKAEKSKKSKRGRPYPRPGSSMTTTHAQSTHVAGQQGTQIRPGLCFTCGKAGHWRHECPSNRPNNKISTNYVNCCPRNSVSTCLKEGQITLSPMGVSSHTVVESESLVSTCVRSEHKPTVQDTGSYPERATQPGIGLKQTLTSKLDEAGLHSGDFRYRSLTDHMADYLLRSKADTTVYKYEHAFAQFQRFCDVNDLSSKPALPISVAMYITSLLDKGKTNHVVSSAFYGIKWAHCINDLTDPTESSMVKLLLDSAKRISSKPVQKKDVLTSDMFQSLCSYYKDSTDVIDLRDMSMIMLAYSGFMRINEVMNLYCNDVQFKSDHLVILLKKSKTDVYRKGSEIVISKGITDACPYSILQRYMSAANLSVNSDGYLFKPAFRSKNVTSLIKKNKKLSYTRTRECIVKKLKTVGPNLNLGTHSLRASGASTVANTPGVSDRCLKRHGRWKTDVAKDGYVEDSLETRLSVTKTLNL